MIGRCSKPPGKKMSRAPGVIRQLNGMMARAASFLARLIGAAPRAGGEAGPMSRRAHHHRARPIVMIGRVAPAQARMGVKRRLYGHGL